MTDSRASITITAERPDTPDAIALIGELQTHLESFYPPESRHGFSVERSIAESVAFFVLRAGGQPAGCGGIKLFDRDYGEVKRLYEREGFRRIPRFGPYTNDPVSLCYGKRLSLD